MTPMISRRPQIGSVTLSLLAALWLFFVPNAAFWRATAAGFEGADMAFLAFSLGLLALTAAGIVAFSVKYLIKPFLIALILIAAVASYYADTFGTVIDKDMIRNAAVTTPAEAKHLITWAFAGHVALYGLLPSLLVAFVRVRHRNFLGKLLHNLAVAAACLALTAGLLIWQFATISTTVRAHHDMLARLNPFGPIAGAIGYGLDSYEEITAVYRPIGQDARIGRRLGAKGKPVVTVIVAGETARAMNFSLNGYRRNTNPELSALDIVNFSNTSSCGTATAVSLPCMFSVYTRGDYTDMKGRFTGNLMNVLAQAGIEGNWWDNNTGSKGIADLISFSSTVAGKDPRYCREGECDDGIFLETLEKKLSGITRDTTIVLHQIGSHGPSYFLRYPPDFARFKPDCRTPQLSDCSHEELVNAYDNTILYTDHILASVIGLLRANADRFDSSMVYMSDHGESLGENGLFLHGAPYAFAPEEQTHVPFIAWFSEGYRQRARLSLSCLRGKSAAPMSHDNLFHTVLGLMDVETAVYDAKLDAFAACRDQGGQEFPQS